MNGLKNKVLIVIDYQNDFVDGSLGFPKAVEMHDKMIEKIINHYNNGGYVVFTKDTHKADYLTTREGKALPVEHCIEGTRGHSLYGGLERISEVLTDSYQGMVVNKRTFGLHIGGDLGRVLENAESIELCGICTNICVVSVAVAVQIHCPETTLTVDASLCASFDDELHEKALDVMQGLQINVINREVQCNDKN